MSGSDLSNRVIEQFSDRSDRADIWRAFDLVLPTDRFLNMGYSRRYQSHLLGEPQLRLVERVADELSSLEDRWADGRLLDLGCGRGGAAAYVADAYGVDVVGVDLVPFNVETAVARSTQSGRSPAFVVGDATRMPFDRHAFTACFAIDSIVYVPDKRDLFAELDRVLVPNGVCVVSDLLAASETDPDDCVFRRFCDAWDMPSLWTLDAYRSALEAAGFSVTSVADLTPHSVARFRKWTALFLRLADGPLGRLLDSTLASRGLDPDSIVDQVRAAHDALPGLRHVLVSIRSSDVRR